MLFLQRIIFSFLLCFSFCHAASTKPLVLVSLSPYTQLVEQLCEGSCIVETVIPATADIHFYEPTIQDMQRIAQASCWFGIGESFEQKILQAIKPQSKIHYVNLSTYLSLRKSSCGCKHNPSYDLHIWMDPGLMEKQLEVVKDTLIALGLCEKDQCTKRFELLQKQLQELNIFCQETLAPFKGEAVIVSHPSFGYYCEAYNLIQLSIETEGKAPKTGDLEALVKQAKQLHVRCIFNQMQFESKAAHTLALLLQKPLFVVNPYEKNYEKMIRELTNYIAQSK